MFGEEGDEVGGADVAVAVAVEVGGPPGYWGVYVWCRRLPATFVAAVVLRASCCPDAEVALTEP